MAPKNRKTRLGLWTAFLLVPTLLLASPSFASGLDAAPANDNRAAAELIATGPATRTGTNAGATLEAGEPRPCGGMAATVWYLYTGIPSGATTVDTAGSNYDTVLAIYRYDAVSDSLVLVGCNDDAPGLGLRSRVSFTSSLGQLYYIQVGGYFGGQGNIVLNVVV